MESRLPMASHFWYNLSFCFVVSVWFYKSHYFRPTNVLAKLFNCQSRTTCPCGAYMSNAMCRLLIFLETDTAPHFGQQYLVIPFSSCHASCTRWQLWHTTFTGLPYFCITCYPPFPIHTTVLVLSNFYCGVGISTAKVGPFVFPRIFENGAIPKDSTLLC